MKKKKEKFKEWKKKKKNQRNEIKKNEGRKIKTVNNTTEIYQTHNFIHLIFKYFTAKWKKNNQKTHKI